MPRLVVIIIFVDREMTSVGGERDPLLQFAERVYPNDG